MISRDRDVAPPSIVCPHLSKRATRASVRRGRSPVVKSGIGDVDFRPTATVRPVVKTESKNARAGFDLEPLRCHDSRHLGLLMADRSPNVETLSYFEHAMRRLTVLARATGLEAELGTIEKVFGFLVEPWGARPIAGGTHGWCSDVADDHTPYEFSLAYCDGEPELRILVEAQHEEPSLHHNWKAGLDLSRRIAERFGVSMERHDAIVDSFEPHPGASMGIWHAVSFRASRAPEFKVYFDTQAKGVWQAPAIAEEALCRLGFTKAWPAVSEVGPRGPELDELKYASLDLMCSEQARVKLYWRHREASADDLAVFMSRLGAPRDAVVEFCRTLGGSEGPYRTRPVFSCTSLTEPSSARASSWTIYFPIAAYAPSDAVAVDRVRRIARVHGIEEAYVTTIEQYADRPLRGTSSLQSYVALSPRGEHQRLTIYLNPEAETVAPARSDLSVQPPSEDLRPARDIVAQYENDVVLADHPFLRRLGREPVNLGHLWLVMANFWEAIVSDFPARLSRVIARLDDDRLRCIFVKQLNDELGEGDFTKAHKALFSTLVAALEPHRMPGDDDVLLAPGRALHRALEHHLFDGDVGEVLGALMMIEIYGKQVDVRLGEEFRRQHVLDRSALRWLFLHEELEVDHADDSMVVARLFREPGDSPESDVRLAGAWRGARGVTLASRKYFDALYDLCFSRSDSDR